MTDKKDTLIELYKEGIETVGNIKYQSELWLQKDIPYSTKLFLEAIIQSCKGYLEKCKK
jgi:hypothetical protein